MAAAMSAAEAGSLTGVLLVPLALLIVLLCLAVKWVPRHHVRYVTRQRKYTLWWVDWVPSRTYYRTLKPGLRMVVPGIDWVSAPVGWPDTTAEPPPPPPELTHAEHP